MKRLCWTIALLIGAAAAPAGRADAPSSHGDYLKRVAAHKPDHARAAKGGKGKHAHHFTPVTFHHDRRYQVNTEKDFRALSHLPLGHVQTTGSKQLPAGKHALVLVRNKAGRLEAHLAREGGKTVRTAGKVEARLHGPGVRPLPNLVQHGSILLDLWMPLFDLNGNLVFWLHVLIFIP
jgi:hypothetical protein